MSKGYGTMMRNVLRATSTTECIAVLDLVRELAGKPAHGADRAIEVSVRRACKRLAAQGYLELAYRALRTGNIRAEPPAKGRQQAKLMVRRKMFVRLAGKHQERDERSG